MSELSDRKTTSFFLSIGTGIALEALFTPRTDVYDPSRDMPTRVDIINYSSIYINLMTLFRNITTSISKEDFLAASPDELKDTMEFEIDIINSLFATEGSGTCKPIYYYCLYNRLVNTAKKGITFRQDKTDFQKFYTYKLIQTLKLLYKDTDEHLLLDSEIKPKFKNEKSIIITHIPYDLISYSNFATLDLLESNTGKLKKRHLWYTKYSPLGDLDFSNIPFIKRLLLVFGDKILIHPMPVSLRRSIVDIAKLRDWTAMTTDAKVLLDLKLSMKDTFSLNFLTSL